MEGETGQGRGGKEGQGVCREGYRRGSHGRIGTEQGNMGVGWSKVRQGGM